MPHRRLADFSAGDTRMGNDFDEAPEFGVDVPCFAFGAAWLEPFDGVVTKKSDI